MGTPELALASLLRHCSQAWCDAQCLDILGGATEKASACAGTIAGRGISDGTLRGQRDVPRRSSTSDGRPRLLVERGCYAVVRARDLEP